LSFCMHCLPSLYSIHLIKYSNQTNELQIVNRAALKQTTD
jgi:hypothetical protein